MTILFDNLEYDNLSRLGNPSYPSLAPQTVEPFVRGSSTPVLDPLADLTGTSP